MEDDMNLFLAWVNGDDASMESSCSIKHDSYGDYVTYSDGSVEYIIIGD